MLLNLAMQLCIVILTVKVTSCYNNEWAQERKFNKSE